MMMNNNFTNLSSIPCFYFCPEDGETVNEPNCFFIPADRHKIVTLKDVKKNFPFEGNYVFRSDRTKSVRIVNPLN